MTREDTKRWLDQYDAMGFGPLDPAKRAVMQAYVDGVDIEWSDEGLIEWLPAPDPAWIWTRYDYRVKQDPIRPYTVYELSGMLHFRGSNEIKHKVTHQMNRITRLDFDDTKLVLCIGSHEWITLEDLANTFTWLDGTPCGIVE